LICVSLTSVEPLFPGAKRRDYMRGFPSLRIK